MFKVIKVLPTNQQSTIMISDTLEYAIESATYANSISNGQHIIMILDTDTGKHRSPSDYIMSKFNNDYCDLSATYQTTKLNFDTAKDYINDLLVLTNAYYKAENAIDTTRELYIEDDYIIVPMTDGLDYMVYKDAESGSIYGEC